MMTTTSNNEEESNKPAHTENIVGNQRCQCGCVPNILSLFEMAELRAKKRAADALKAKNVESNIKWNEIDQWIGSVFLLTLFSVSMIQW